MIRTFSSPRPLAYAPFTVLRKSNQMAPAWTVTGVNSLQTSMALTVESDGLIVPMPSGTSIETPSVPVAGTDYAVWCDPNGRLIASANFVMPPVAKGIYIGHYHYAPGGNAPAQSGGSNVPQINSHSCFDLNYRPKPQDGRGMTCVAGSLCADIYLCNTSPDVNGTSMYMVTIADGSSPPKIPVTLGGNGAQGYGSLTWFEAASLLGAYGKRLPTYQEFMLLAFGVTEATSHGSLPPSTALDAPRTSRWGVMQAAGNMYVWGRELGGPYGATSWSANTEGFGSTYNLPNAALLGGDGANGAVSGSRCSYWGLAPSSSYESFGARGVSDLLILA